MAAQTEDKKLDGAGLSVLWGLIKNIIPTVPTNVSSFTNDAAYVSLLDTHNQNLVLASPNGASGLPSFRALAASDIPDLSGTYLTSASLNGYATQSWVTSQGFGTVSSIKVGTTSYSPSSGVVSLPAYPTTLPASDVYSWAKQSTKPSYSWSEIGSRPTKLSEFTNDSGFITGITSSMVTTALGFTPANSTSLASYLPLTGGIISVSSKTHAYPLTIKNRYHSSDSTFAVGSGIKLELGDASESTKYASIMAESVESWENKIDLHFYISNSGTEKEVMGFSASGDVLFDGSVLLKGGSSGNRRFGFTRNNNGANMDVGWNWDNVDGAGAYFRSSDYTDAGEFGFFARSSSSNTKKLIGTTDGNLAWDGQIISKPIRDTWAGAFKGFCASLSGGQAVVITIGKSASANNSGAIQYHHVSDGSSSNYMAISIYDNDRLLTVNGAGNVGIGMGTTAPSYKLQVNGAVGATAFTNTSDIRNKDFISDTSMSIEQIANAPSFKFKWKTGDDRNVHAGSSAQYWNMVLPETVSAAKDEQHTLSMQYDVIALLSAITIAKEVVNDKERIRQLEQRVSQLEAQLAN